MGWGGVGWGGVGWGGVGSLRRARFVEKGAAADGGGSIEGPEMEGKKSNLDDCHVSCDSESNEKRFPPFPRERVTENPSLSSISQKPSSSSSGFHRREMNFLTSNYNIAGARSPICPLSSQCPAFSSARAQQTTSAKTNEEGE